MPRTQPAFDLLDQALQHYEATWLAQGAFDAEGQKTFLKRFRETLDAERLSFSRRDFLPGHLTGSTMIVTSDLTRVLLTLHGKLGKWLQLGGHAEAPEAMSAIAYREAEEESGLADLDFFPLSVFPTTGTEPLILDLDIHEIPAWQADPAHLHFDVRYLVRAPNPDAIVVSEESKALRWFTLDEAYRVTSEPSMHR